MMHALIIDDEPASCEVVHLRIKMYCTEIQVVSFCYSAEEGIKKIEEKKPDLIFLDIDMPDMNGFEMLDKIASHSFDLVVMADHDQYALKAFQYGALYYLLKPVDSGELQKAVQTIQLRQKKYPNQQLEVFSKKIGPVPTLTGKIAMPTLEGLQMITIDHIISAESDSNYTILLLKKKQRITVSKTLKEIEELLDGYSFLRVHHSHLVNLNEISKYVKGEGGYLVMSDGTTVDVSRSKKEVLLKILLNGRK